MPSLFAWSSPQRPGVWQRRERPAEVTDLEDPLEEDAFSVAGDHNYVSLPDPAVVDLGLQENKSLREVNGLREEMASMALRQRFGIHRFAHSDQDIRFFAR